MPRDDYRYAREAMDRMNSAASTEAGYGSRASGAYLDRATSFDASESLNRYARGAWGSISEALGHQLRDLKGSSVGAGRFDSGFFDEDTGEVVNRATSQFSNAIAQQSMGALAAEQRNTESLGNFGSEARGNAMDLYTSEREIQENAYRDNEERKRRRRQGIGSAIGGLLGAGVGAMAGGPAGASVGWQAGSGIGGAF